ncbi:hypothetical protein OS493_032236 [Desmophyllum pertusum]|uniref:Uncharacterized protein n=1 Tax=Desmophyllum pertusum TaxID=174260 RepID=A0A9W9ZJI9_9CNID|nr:hypothetical protein OS493_032236 [Desmophyllum pertusum]
MTAENMGKVRNEATMVKSLPQTPLDALLAGYSRTQLKVNNPDRPLTGPLAEKECSMYLKLAQLAKDAVSCLHPPKYLAFYKHLCLLAPQPEVDGVLFANHTSPNSKDLLLLQSAWIH